MFVKAWFGAGLMKVLVNVEVWPGGWKPPQLSMAALKLVG